VTRSSGLPARADALHTAVLVEIWSDVVCPWCYIGKRRFEAALAGFEHRDHVDVRWRSLELNPRASTTGERDLVTHLSEKYAVPGAEARSMIERITEAAAGEGLEYDLDRARPTGTFDAHRLLHLAHARGVQDELEERLMSAYCSEGRLIGDAATLIELSTEVGLDADEVREVLAGDAYATAVRADEADGHQLGLTGVPFFVVDRRVAAAGAHPSENLLRLLRSAWEERATVP
jgi:predicted DsbA family dithiol-disulfide isomerase